MSEKYVKVRLDYLTLIKSILYRFIATGTTSIIIYVYTRQLTLSLGIGITDFVVKIFVYYAYDKAWSRFILKIK